MSRVLEKTSFDVLISLTSSFKYVMVLVLQINSFLFSPALASKNSTMLDIILISSCLSFDNIFSFLLESMSVFSHSFILAISSLCCYSCFSGPSFDVSSSVIYSFKRDIVFSFSSFIVSDNSLDSFNVIISICLSGDNIFILLFDSIYALDFKVNSPLSSLYVECTNITFTC